MIDQQYTIEFGDTKPRPGGNIETGQQRVNTAVAVIVTHAEQVLVGRRQANGDGFEWQLPGGWIEVGESPLQTSRREVFEETGLSLREPMFVGISNNVFSPHRHSISLYFEAECVDPGVLITAEGKKCQGWEWKRWVEIDYHLFLPLRLIRQTGYQPFLQRDLHTGVSI